MKKAIYQLGLWSLIIAMFVACKDEGDEPQAAETIASFQSEVSTTNFLEVTFTNASRNFVSSSWDFDDGNTSDQESPVHIYEAAGTYEVTLTVTAQDGTTDSKTNTVEIEDPNAKLTLLTGVESKTWKLLREGTAMLLAADPQYSEIYWAGSSNNGQRPCLYDDSFTFTRDGSYIYDDAGSFWGEYGVWGGDGVATNTDNFEVCFDATAANMINGDGVDVSAWLSGTHDFTYDANNNTITLTGEGAWIGIPKLATSGAVTVPQDEVTFDVTLVDGGTSGVDSMFVAFEYEGNFWPITYVSYENPADEPALVTDFEEPACDPYDAVSPTEISHTFASNDPSEWVLLQFDATSGAGLTLGVDDPTDVNAQKVGLYTRNAGVQYQELIFELDPINSINFENLSTVTMDVYLPSSNTYGDLTDNVFVGFGNRKCPPNWYEDQHEYQETGIAKDQWVTITFDLNAPDYVANEGNGATVYERNDLDMIYIAIGGGGHTVGGEFYMRNFSIQ